MNVSITEKIMSCEGIINRKSNKIILHPEINFFYR
jgi:hypothetical protein